MPVSWTLLGDTSSPIGQQLRWPWDYRILAHPLIADSMACDWALSLCTFGAPCLTWRLLCSGTRLISCLVCWTHLEETSNNAFVFSSSVSEERVLGHCSFFWKFDVRSGTSAWKGSPLWQSSLFLSDIQHRCESYSCQTKPCIASMPQNDLLFHMDTVNLWFNSVFCVRSCRSGVSGISHAAVKVAEVENVQCWS